MSCFLSFSCNAKKEVKEKNGVVKTEIPCPKDGICTFEVMQNKSLNILQDEIKAFYPQISDGNKIILKFQYKRNEIPNTADGGYTELIYVELDANNLEIDLENSQLQEVKLLFARLCFCRGQTGYYKVKKGILSIKKEKDTYFFNLNFTVPQVPQITTSINQSFVLK